MVRRPFALVSGLCAALVLATAGAPGAPTAETSQPSRDSVYSISTVVVYNTAVPESKSVAEFYAGARRIDGAQIVGVTCPDREEISRAEFEGTILEPLRTAFLRNDWWDLTLDPQSGMRVKSNRMHLIVLVYGMPLKVRNDLPPPTQPAGAQGQGQDQEPAPAPKPPSPSDTSACSVDSELSLLGFGHEKRGVWENPYFEATADFYKSRHPGMVLVGRVDGPSAEVAKRLVRDSIAVEAEGLWGYAYVDEARKLQLGDDWLRRSAEGFAREGIPVVLDRHPARFPSGYPMDYAALYFGWYSDQVDGPFLSPSFRFLPGAVACHLHSFSAAMLRSDSKHWAGPLLQRGAAAVLGNVYEPFLTGTHHLDIFNDRLLKGFTFIESAYMAAPALSWMAVAVGDPLYRPFESANRYDRESYAKGAGEDLKALRLATKRWALEDPERFHTECAAAAAKLKSGRIYEAIALAAANRGDTEDAILWFERALKEFSTGRDQLRVQLHRVDLARRLGSKDEAVALLEFLIARLGSAPEAAAPIAILNDMRPPLPPSP